MAQLTLKSSPVSIRNYSTGVMLSQCPAHDEWSEGPALGTVGAHQEHEPRSPYWWWLSEPVTMGKEVIAS